LRVFETSNLDILMVIEKERLADGICIERDEKLIADLKLFLRAANGS